MKAAITWNKEMTIEEARRLLSSSGMSYPDTDHNRKMIAQATKEFIRTLRK